jgi:tetratricopeptide (TPR) repeat protein
MPNRVVAGRWRAAFVFVCVALTVGACASATKRYEQGLALEERGRPADAAARYVDALRKDPLLVEARWRLRESGDLAVAEYLGGAREADAAGRAGEAAEALLRLDALRGDAAGVGVELPVHADYADERRGVLNRAIAAAVRDGRGAAASGGWTGALRGLDAAVDRWEPSAAQRAEIDAARLEAFLAWGGAESQRGRHRAAYDVAERALRMLGPEYRDAHRLRSLQAEALRRGTVRVAVLPVGAGRRVQEEVGDDFVPELNDLLADGPLLAPPPFLEVVDPREVTRDVRWHGYARQTISPRDAARVGLALGADLVVIAEVDSVRMARVDVRETRRAVRTRDGADTAYVVEQGRRTGWVRVAYDVVDARSGRVLESGTVHADADHRFRRGVFAGDARTLALPRGDRDLFDAEAARREERAFVERLASATRARYARQVFDRLLRRVD